MSAIKIVLHKIWIEMVSLIGVFVKSPRPMVFVGADSSLNLLRHITRSGAKHLLIVTDAMLESLGLVDGVIKQAEAEGLKVTVYSKIEPNPSLEQLKSTTLRWIEQAGSQWWCPLWR